MYQSFLFRRLSPRTPVLADDPLGALSEPTPSEPPPPPPPEDEPILPKHDLSVSPKLFHRRSNSFQDDPAEDHQGYKPSSTLALFYLQHFHKYTCTVHVIIEIYLK